MKANFLAVGLVVRSTIKNNILNYLRYETKVKNTYINDISNIRYKNIIAKQFCHLMLFYFF